MTENQLKYLAHQENVRHNQAQESQKVDELKETSRSNLARESETNRSNVAKERETFRSNVAKETDADLDRQIKASVAEVEKLATAVKAGSQLGRDIIGGATDIMKLTKGSGTSNNFKNLVVKLYNK